MGRISTGTKSKKKHYVAMLYRVEEIKETLKVMTWPHSSDADFYDKIRERHLLAGDLQLLQDKIFNLEHGFKELGFEGIIPPSKNFWCTNNARDYLTNDYHEVRANNPALKVRRNVSKGMVPKTEKV